LTRADAWRPAARATEESITAQIYFADDFAQYSAVTDQYDSVLSSPAVDYAYGGGGRSGRVVGYSWGVTRSSHRSIAYDAAVS
jgi:hypothetical protein